MNKCKVLGCPRVRRGRYLKCNPCQNSLRRYGIDSVEREKLLESQNNCCLICLKIIKFEGKRGPKGNDAVIDHSHFTNKIRGVLCSRCNTLVSIIEDNKIDIDRVGMYLY